MAFPSFPNFCCKFLKKVLPETGVLDRFIKTVPEGETDRFNPNLGLLLFLVDFLISVFMFVKPISFSVLIYFCTISTSIFTSIGSMIL